ncbi:MAG: hypothetical protein RLY86_821 [Pseudomonadota bacterium]|jgi:uncharacterized iron-regulated membrane protein
MTDTVAVGAGYALLHRWSGLMLGAALFRLGLTGALLVLRPKLTALKHPDQAARPPPWAEAAWPQRLDTIQARYGDQLRSVKTPVPWENLWRWHA